MQPATAHNIRLDMVSVCVSLYFGSQGSDKSHSETGGISTLPCRSRTSAQIRVVQNFPASLLGPKCQDTPPVSLYDHANSGS